MNSENKRPSINVLFIASEADPLIKIGGLGDVAGSLPLALKKLTTQADSTVDLDIRLALPYYGQLKKTALTPKKVGEFSLPTEEEPLKVTVYQTDLNGIPLYLLDSALLEADAPVYGTDFKADARKFIFFSLACLQLPRLLNWRLDILHANDWHTAIAVHELSVLAKTDPAYHHIRSIISVHNLPFMGTGSEVGLTYFQVPFSKNPRMPKWARSLPLPMGINAADRIIAVSPGYAKEIMTPEYGCDLQDFLITKKARLSGIVNGIDPEVWNPQTDVNIPQTYAISPLEKRSLNKQALQKELGLPESDVTPLMAFIGRMDRQKGIDLAMDALKQLKTIPWQMVFLGTGNAQIEADLKALQEFYPNQIRLALRFDAALSHRIYGGADILLMPSRYEPCGLAQMIAMRYGCIPVARATGGLKDTIENNKTGFLFEGNDGDAMTVGLKQALKLFPQKDKWQALQINAMNTDFSWQNSASDYLHVYQDLTQVN
ncbi:MAG: glycogen/starch synthase [Anaerolineaceae bacterium]|nr:glycogen/starch synthase [Anaerolineaceae bacterium]